jgi:hypothetical protein
MGQASDPQQGAGGHNPPPRPAAPPNPWSALDAESREDRPPPPERSTQLPTVGFSGRFWKVDVEQPSDPRVRYERPILLAWLLISCLWQGFIPWVVMGLALIVYAGAARRVFRQYGLVAQPWVYCAAGVGQIMLAWSYIAKLGPLWPFIGLYWLGVVLAWVIVELRTVRGTRGDSSVF